nr:unnamed protein product [Callosobruchus chinensis]
MALLISQINLGDTDKAALIGVCLFIVLVYVKPWLHCILAVKAPFQGLCFLKALKAYEEIDETISIVALKKFNQHLWYLTDEAAALALFDDDVDIETKVKIVRNFDVESISSHGKLYVPLKEELDGSLYGKLNLKCSFCLIWFRSLFFRSINTYFLFQRNISMTLYQSRARCYSLA